MPFLVSAFFIGILCLQLFPVLPSFYPIITSLSVLIILNLIIYKFFLWRFLKLTIIIGIGFLWAWGYTSFALSHKLPETIVGRPVTLTGYIATLPKFANHHATFVFKTISVAGQARHLNIRLSWYGHYPKLIVGDKWQLEAHLDYPHGNVNPGGFDLAKYLFEHKIFVVGYVVAGGSNLHLPAKFFFHSIDRARQYLRYAINHTLYNAPLRSLIITLVVGDHNNITPQQWTVLQNTGTSYLMAIAGLHIGLVAGFMLYLVQFLWRQFPRMVLFFPARQAGAIAGLVSGFAYSVISGFSVPTRRSLIMLVVFLFTLMFKISHKAWNALFLSLLIILLINPMVILEIGFWLSFSAVAFIIYFSSNRLKFRLSWWKKYCRMQWVVILGLMPFTLLFFQKIALTTFLANIIAMPLVCSVVVPLSLLGSLILLINAPAAHLILLAAEKLMELTWLWLSYLSDIPNIMWQHPIFNLWILLAALIGIIIVLAPRGMQGRLLSLFWLLPLFFYKPGVPEMGALRLSLLDMRRGMAVIIVTHKHALLYYHLQTTSQKKSGQVERIILPFLRQTGVARLDLLISNAKNPDLTLLLAAIPVRALVVEQNASQRLSNWQWDAVQFMVMHPGVFKATVFKGKSIIFTGNAKGLVGNFLPDVAVLVQPYSVHKNSTIAAKVKYILYAISYRNFKHFFGKKQLNAAQQKFPCNTRVYYTATSGAITVEIGDRVKFSPK